MNLLNRLKKEYATLYTPDKESVLKSAAGVMVSSAVISVILFGISTGMTQLIGLLIK